MTIDIAYYNRLSYEFHTRVGTLRYYEDLESLGLSPKDIIGSFWPEDVPRLQSYCQENPEYHIVTRVSANLEVNRYVPGDHKYFLANGDKSEDLEIYYPPEVIDHMMSEIELILIRVKPELGSKIS